MSPFFKFSDNTVYNTEFTWAMSIRPRSDMVDQVCQHCGVRKNYPSGAFDVEVEGGREYPDVLGCGAFPFLIVSRAVANDWKEAGITSFHTFPVGIAEVRSKRLNGVSAPEYLRVEIDGACQIDLEASGLQVENRCSECGHVHLKPTGISGYKMVPNSWDDSPLFRDPVLFPQVNFCNELVFETAGRHRRSNFRFEPMEGPIEYTSKGIEYLK
jgi:hypothetical protein